MYGNINAHAYMILSSKCPNECLDSSDSFLVQIYSLSCKNLLFIVEIKVYGSVNNSVQ